MIRKTIAASMFISALVAFVGCKQGSFGGSAGQPGVGPSPGPAPAGANDSGTPLGASEPTSVAPLAGLWDAEGYTEFTPDGSPVKVPMEVIEISVDGDAFIGRKVTGDNAVPAGNLSFKGTRSGSKVSVQFYGSYSAGGTPTLESDVMTGFYSNNMLTIPSPHGNPTIALTPHKS